jgi:hypothetical protein
MAKRKQYADLILHPNASNSDLENCKMYPELFKVISAYADAISTANVPIFVTEIRYRNGGTFIDITLGTSEGFRVLKITYERDKLKYYIGVFHNLYVVTVNTFIRSDNHSYVVSQATKLGNHIRTGKRIHKLADYVLDRLDEVPRQPERIEDELKRVVRSKLNTGISTYNLRYTFDEDQIKQLALYAFDRENHPTIGQDILKIYQDWKMGEDQSHKVEVDTAAFFDRPKWVVIVNKNIDDGDHKPTQFFVGARDGKEMLIPFQLYKSFDSLPDYIREELVVSLTMARVYSAGQGVELDDDFIPKVSPTYRNSRIAYPEIGYAHSCENNYSFITVDYVEIL